MPGSLLTGDRGNKLEPDNVAQGDEAVLRVNDDRHPVLCDSLSLPRCSTFCLALFRDFF